MHIELRETPFEPLAALAHHQDSQPHLRGRFGATASFVGTMRDSNEGDAVQVMTLEHYPGMTEKQLAAIVAEAEQRWTLLDVLVIHRVGRLHPGDPIVLVGVWSGHRHDAFDACRYIMEALKSRATFWKKETLASGERWVEKNTTGYGDQG
mgnify:CR=1 FL=1